MASMLIPSRIPADLVWRLKAATRDLLNRAGGTTRAAEITGLSTTHLHRCGSDTDENMSSVLPLLAVYLLEHDTGRATVSRLMAAASGHEVCSAGQIETPAPRVPVAFTETLSAVGALCRDTAASLEDGGISQNEAKAIYEAGEDARAAIEALQRAASAAVAARRVQIVKR